MMKKWILFVGILVVCAATASAETIFLKSGKVLRGAIVTRTPIYIRVSVGGGLYQEFLLDDIDRIGADEEYEAIATSVVKKASGSVAVVAVPAATAPQKSIAAPPSLGQRGMTRAVVITETVRLSGEQQVGAVSGGVPAYGKVDVFTQMQSQLRTVLWKISRARSAATAGVIIMIMLIIFLGTYIVSCLPLHILARKTGNVHPALVWIPVVNLYALCRLAQKPGWWMVLFFVPVLNVIIFILIWSAIAEIRGRHPLVGLLMIVPGVFVVVPWYLALCSDRMIEVPMEKEEKKTALLKKESVTPGDSYDDRNLNTVERDHLRGLRDSIRQQKREQPGSDKRI